MTSPALSTVPVRLRRTTEPTELFDLASAADYLGVRPRMARRLVAERRVPFVRIGRHVRIARRDLDDFLRDHRVEAVR